MQKCLLTKYSTKINVVLIFWIDVHYVEMYYKLSRDLGNWGDAWRLWIQRTCIEKKTLKCDKDTETREEKLQREMNVGANGYIKLLLLFMIRQVVHKNLKPLMVTCSLLFSFMPSPQHGTETLQPQGVSWFLAGEGSV